MDRPSALRRTLAALAFPLFFTQACFSYDGCDLDFDDCESDEQCLEGQLCAAQGFSLGRSCIDVAPCESDVDCARYGGRCDEVPGEERDHPFEAAQPVRYACDCDGWFCEPSDAEDTPTTSVGGQGGATSGEGGAGGAGGEGGGA